MVSFKKISLTLLCLGFISPSLLAHEALPQQKNVTPDNHNVYVFDLAKNQYRDASSLKAEIQAALSPKQRIEFAIEKGTFGNANVENSVAFALTIADESFPGWRDYETIKGISETRSIDQSDDAQTSIMNKSFVANGTAEGKASWWGLSVDYDVQNLGTNWTVSISVTKGAYTGKIILTFAPLKVMGKFALISYVREFTPSNLVIVCPEEAEQVLVADAPQEPQP